MVFTQRSALVSFIASLSLAIGCSTASTSPNDAGSSQVSAALDIGKPCIPAMENDPKFGGTSEQEVSIETSSPSCVTGTCLSNHFRGRVSCPYGQDAQGHGVAGSSPCTTPDGGAPVTVAVEAECADRNATEAVYCSCRCANAAGRSDDDAGPYCACGDGFTCTQLVAPIGTSTDSTLAGAYCVKTGTAYDRASACAQSCDPATSPCP